MPGYRLKPLPYYADGTLWLTRLSHWPQRVWLDSARPHSQAGRWDVISADPLESSILPMPLPALSDHPFHAFDELLGPPIGLTESAPVAQLPFAGGLIGAAAYPFGEQAIGLPRNASPSAWAGFYDWAILTDHHQQQSWLVAHPRCTSERWQHVQALLLAPGQPAPAPFRLTAPWQSNLHRPAYQQAFEQVQRFIQRGDCYQINLARRFSSHYEGDPLQAYHQLRCLAAAPFSAYFELPDATLLCLSPERFLQVNQGHLLTQPIKGTAPRHPDPEQDSRLAAALLASAKNQAENMMIVDLLRNDLGQIAEIGSVTVSSLLSLHSFATVHHLVSTIEARLAPKHTPLAALAACFPGGSITGAPKRRVIEIIHSLEPDPRDYYCGSVFWADSRGSLDSNITIRSLVCRDGAIHAWAGGGIVADSCADEEFHETEVKMGRLLDALHSACPTDTSMQ